MDIIYIASFITLIMLLAATSYTELTSKTIPNKVTYTGMLLGLCYGFLPGGIALGPSVTGLLVGFGVMFLFYVFGGMGGGDVKLMGAVGALLGFQYIFAILIYSSLFGAIMAIVCLAWNRQLWSGVARALMLFFTRKKKRRKSVTSELGETVEKLTIPYGLAIASGTIMALFTV